MRKWEAALRLTGVGFFIGGSIVLGLFCGIWLDNWLNTRLLWLLGLVCGLVLAFYGVYRMLVPLMGNKRDKENG